MVIGPGKRARSVGEQQRRRPERLTQRAAQGADLGPSGRGHRRRPERAVLGRPGKQRAAVGAECGTQRVAGLLRRTAVASHKDDAGRAARRPAPAAPARRWAVRTALARRARPRSRPRRACSARRSRLRRPDEARSPCCSRRPRTGSSGDRTGRPAGARRARARRRREVVTSARPSAATASAGASSEPGPSRCGAPEQRPGWSDHDVDRLASARPLARVHDERLPARVDPRLEALEHRRRDTRVECLRRTERGATARAPRRAQPPVLPQTDAFGPCHHGIAARPRSRRRPSPTSRAASVNGGPHAPAGLAQRHPQTPAIGSRQDRGTVCVGRHYRALDPASERHACGPEPARSDCTASNSAPPSYHRRSSPARRSAAGMRRRRRRAGTAVRRTARQPPEPGTRAG